MNLEKEVSMAKITKDAEDLFRRGFFRSEVVIYSIHNNFKTDVPKEVIAMASGFPTGTGRSKCLCGTMSGGIMTTGLVFGRTVQKDPQVEQALALFRELHDWFEVINGKNALHCRVLTKEFDMGAGEYKEQCIHFTGLVAGKMAEMTIREKGLTNIDK